MLFIIESPGGGCARDNLPGLDDSPESVPTLSVEEEEMEMRNLTQEEIWDDSSLVRTWDDAVAEYQRYHSIAARGENVEDVLREAEAAGALDDVEDLGEGEDVGNDEDAGEDADEQAASDDAEPQPDGRSASAATPVAPYLGPGTPSSTAGRPTAADAQGPPFAPDGIPTPAPVLSNVQDENLKNLMMAWYYAGYYTGLYQGQQQAAEGEN